MGTVSIPFDVSAARPDITNTPELAFINGANFPPDGYAFPQSSAKAIYLRLDALQYGGGNLTLNLKWYSRAGSTTGNVTWSAALGAITPGDPVSVEAKTFATAQSTTTAVNATAKGETLTTITISNLDSLGNGDSAWIKVTRTDTSMTGDALLIGADLAYGDGNSGTPGSGDVVGPASSTTNALQRFADTTGKLGKNSPVVCDDSGNLTGVGTVNTVSVTAHASRHLPGGADSAFSGTYSSGDIPEWNGSAWIAKYTDIKASSADQSIATTTQTAVTGLSFTLPRAGTYYFEFELQTTTATAAATQVFSVSYSGTTTGGIANTYLTTTATTVAVASSTTFTTAGTMSGTRTTLTTAFPVRVAGSITVSTSGTLQLNAASGAGTSALVVKARSGGLCKEQ